jgi:hypothetical protein
MKKIAFLILAHTDPLHFGRLLSSLDRSWCDAYVHIDKKVDIKPFQAEAREHGNVYFVKNRSSIQWAEISMIEAQNALIAEALKRKDEYIHGLFLSGCCYPIKPVRALCEMLHDNPNTEFIKYIDMRNSPDHYIKQITTNNTWNESVNPLFGSQWFASTIKCFEYIMEYQRQNPWFWNMNIKTFAPDEHFYHSIIGNSDFAQRATGMQEFKGRGTWRMANLHIIDPSLAKYYTMCDWPEICVSDKFFVRKVRSLDGHTLIDAIEAELIHGRL